MSLEYKKIKSNYYRLANMNIQIDYSNRFRYKIIICFFCVILLFACGPDNYKTLDDIKITRPEIIDDGDPDISGDFYELVDRKDLNLHQKCLIEALGRFRKSSNDTPTELSSLNFFGVTNLNPLVGLEFTSPILIEIISTRINNIDGLKGFSNLQELTIRGSDLEDFSALNSLTKLKKLDVAYSKAKDISSLKNCISLESLTVDGESNFDESLLKNLLDTHENYLGKKIKLKINRIYGKLGSAKDIASEIIGTYKLNIINIFYKNETRVGSNSASSGQIGSLKLDGKNYNLSYLNPPSNTEEVIETGVYEIIGNLIIFTNQNGVKIVNSFYVNSYYHDFTNLNGFDLVDRERIPDTFNVTYSFSKISNTVNFSGN